MVWKGLGAVGCEARASHLSHPRGAHSGQRPEGWSICSILRRLLLVPPRPPFSLPGPASRSANQRPAASSHVTPGGLRTCCFLSAVGCGRQSARGGCWAAERLHFSPPPASLGIFSFLSLFVLPFFLAPRAPQILSPSLLLMAESCRHSGAASRRGTLSLLGLSRAAGCC